MQIAGRGRGGGDRRAGAGPRPGTVGRPAGRPGGWSRSSTPAGRTWRSSLKFGGTCPRPLFDTQIAAMVCGLRRPGRLRHAGAQLPARSLDKASRFTDWSRRPLTERQLDLCAGRRHSSAHDLRRAGGRAEAQRPPRLDRRGDGACWPTPPPTASTRERLGAAARPERATARSSATEGAGRLARARGAAPQRAAQPRREGRDAVEIAAHPADDHRGAGARPRPLGWTSRAAASAPGMLAALAQAKPMPPDGAAGARGSRRRSAGLQPLLDLLKVLLKLQAREQHGVAQKLLANSDDLEQLAAGDGAKVPALQRLAPRGVRRRRAGAEARAGWRLPRQRHRSRCCGWTRSPSRTPDAVQPVRRTRPMTHCSPLPADGSREGRGAGATARSGSPAPCSEAAVLPRWPARGWSTSLDHADALRLSGARALRAGPATW